MLLSKLETRNSKLETRNSKLETRNSKLETRNPATLFRATSSEAPEDRAPLIYLISIPCACISAWYEERTNGPHAAWVKPSSRAISFSSSNSDGGT